MSVEASAYPVPEGAAVPIEAEVKEAAAALETMLGAAEDGVIVTVDRMVVGMQVLTVMTETDTAEDDEAATPAAVVDGAADGTGVVELTGNGEMTTEEDDDGTATVTVKVEVEVDCETATGVLETA